MSIFLSVILILQCPIPAFILTDLHWSLSICRSTFVLGEAWNMSPFIHGLVNCCLFYIRIRGRCGLLPGEQDSLDRRLVQHRALRTSTHTYEEFSQKQSSLFNQSMSVIVALRSVIVESGDCSSVKCSNPEPNGALRCVLHVVHTLSGPLLVWKWKPASSHLHWFGCDSAVDIDPPVWWGQPCSHAFFLFLPSFSQSWSVIDSGPL